MIFLWFFLKAIAESVNATKAYSRTPDRKKAAEKDVGGRGGGEGNKPSSLKIPFLRFFPTPLYFAPLSSIWTLETG